MALFDNYTNGCWRNNDKFIVLGKLIWRQFSEGFHRISSTFEAGILAGILLYVCDVSMS